MTGKYKSLFRRAAGFLRAHNELDAIQGGWGSVGSAIAKICNIEIPQDVSPRRMGITVTEIAIAKYRENGMRFPHRSSPNRASKRRQRHNFYDSFEWRRVRYQVLKEYGRRCMCCGTTKGMMHVDHIKPLKTHWELRLDMGNLQVLCEACNHGKASWDQTDWRT